ncbi:MAG: SHOCT domain-containing protein [Sphaerochaeta sp.]|uniref:SHOCT domain-containing protein n=1 Tax=Sphaerochaeta sp. TaxID=1972642 RepID=UPI002FC9CDE8
MMLLFIVLIAFVIYYVVKNPRSETTNQKESSAMDILKKRYAMGEITRDEFLTMSKELK